MADLKGTKTEKNLKEIFDAVWILPLAARVAEGFRRGDVSYVGDLSRETGLGDAEIRRLLNRLESRNVVRRVEDDEKAGFVLARPAAAISMRELLPADVPEMKTEGAGDAHQAVMHVHFHIIPKQGDQGLGIRWPARQLGDPEADELQRAIRNALAEKD